MKKFFKTFIIIMTVAGSLAQFQNCAKTDTYFSDEKVADTLSFFSYRYEKATPIYYELQIIPVSSDATYQTYNLMLFAANSDGTTSDIQYEFEVFAKDGKSICPLKTGTLSAGVTKVEESCIALKSAALGRALVKVRNPGEAWEILNTSY